MTDNARARLSAYMTHESDQDQAEFDTRVDAAITEATAKLQAKNKELAGRVSELDKALRAANQLNQVTCANCYQEQTHCSLCHTDLA